MKLTNKHFDVFKKEFLWWQHHLGLMNWQVYCRFVDEGTRRFAGIDCASRGRVATLTLNKHREDQNITHESVKRSAKHEAVHLLLADFLGVAYDRDCDEKDMDKEEEKLVVLLCNLLPRR